MQTIQTLTHPYKRTTFNYTGSVTEGVTLEITGRPDISAVFFTVILRVFRGANIPGGFNETSPTPGGLGEWVEHHSRQMNTVKLYPRHASFIAAILVHEGYITSILKKNAVILHFPDEPLCRVYYGINSYINQTTSHGNSRISNAYN
jgi:hypothetical protein